MSTVQCVVECVKGSAGKFDFDPASGRMRLRKVMPAGLVFPFDFGYIEGTVGEDGDPLDVIMISEVPTFPGCGVDSRIIGAIKARQTERNGVTERNDRFLAIPEVSVLYGRIETLRQLGKQTLVEIERFFVNYNEQAGKRFNPLELSDRKTALQLVHEGFANARPSHLVQLMLPVRDNNGKPFPKRSYEAVRKLLADRFGGVTVYAQSPVTGLWKDGDESLVRDRLLVFEVMVSEVDSHFWQAYKAQLEKRFRQDEILIRRSDIGLF